jgi:SnoaL-like domain
VDVETAARRFATTLREAWPVRDVDRFTALFADGAPFRSALGTPEPAVEHMRRSFALGETTPEVWVGEPLAVGDTATVEWWAVLTLDGEPHSFAGTAWLRFDGDGRVVDEHDYWQSAAGRTEPWAGWGGRLVERS